MKRDSGKPPEQLGTARRGSLRGKLPERPKRQWKWKRKNGQKVSVAARRGSWREKLSERPERSRKWSEKRFRKASGAVRNRAPWVWETKIACKTQVSAALEREERQSRKKKRNVGKSNSATGCAAKRRICLHW